ncbi:MAG: glycine cleavage system protein GcvH [Syntrophales bacterium]|nr:glycine cleavage system protein GcvH [Syntrophales bacterium]
MSFPNDLIYSSEHTWVRVDGDIATVGITGYAQDKLDEILSVELFPIDSSVEQGEPFGVIESVKGATELISPVSGDIVSVNEDLADDVGILNSDAYDTGWMIVVEMSDVGELDNLMDAETYTDYVEANEEDD